MIRRILLQGKTRYMKNALRPLIACAILLYAISPLAAQQNPPFKGWKYIDAGHYRIIFPEGLERTAQRAANLMVYYEPFNYAGMDTSPEYIPIVIIEDYCEANGFVSSAPFYSHWFTTPSSLDSTDWFTGLAIHEGRHMVQRNRLREGAGKYTWSILFGDYGTALFEGLYVPMWYLEGDAVVMETALTHGGRGRVASFPLWYRALEMEGRRYSYSRAFMGTAADMYPYANYYSLGYLMNSHVRRVHGREAWDNVLERTGYFLLFPSFDFATWIETKKSTRSVYNGALDSYREHWKSILLNEKFTTSEIISPQRKPGSQSLWDSGLGFGFMAGPEREISFVSITGDSTDEVCMFPWDFLIPGQRYAWESWLFPFTLNGETYTLRFARDRKLSLMKLTAGGAEELTMMPHDSLSPLFAGERGITAGGERVLWRETVPDPRWGYRSWSDLVIYNVKTGKKERLTSKGKFTASAISPDGLTAAGVEYQEREGYSLLLFSTEKKEKLRSLDINGMGHLFDPALSGDGRAALCSIDKQGNSIIIIDTETGRAEAVIQHTYLEHFRSPVFHGNYLFYVSDYTGIDNIYALDLNTKKRYRVTSVTLGAYYPHVTENGRRLIYNEYHYSGYRAASIKLDPEKWTAFEKLHKPDDPYVEAYTGQELGPDLIVPDDLPEKEYEVKEYYTLTDGMKIPGWLVFFNSTTKDFSVNVVMQDVLNTVSASAGYLYNFNEKTHKGTGTLTWSGLFPVFRITGGYGSRAILLSDDDAEYFRQDYLTWMEKSADGGIEIPLNFSRGIHNTYLSVGATAGMISISDVDPPVFSVYSDLDRNGEMAYASYYLTLQHTITGALNSRIPRWGEVINLLYYHTPFESDYKGRMLSADLTLYLPSVFSTHGFRLCGGYVTNDISDYTFTQALLFPRGYRAVIHEKFISGSADYMFPIADFSLPVWKLIYFKRLNGSVFYDYGRGTTGDLTLDYSSAGFELTLVQNILSNPYLCFEAGLRYSYCFETGEWVPEFVLSIPLLEL